MKSRERGGDCALIHIGGICLENERFLFWGRGVLEKFFFPPQEGWSETEKQERSETRRGRRLDDQKELVRHQSSYARNKLG